MQEAGQGHTKRIDGMIPGGQRRAAQSDRVKAGKAGRQRCRRDA